MCDCSSPTKRGLTGWYPVFCPFCIPTTNLGRRYPNLCHFYIISSDPSVPPPYFIYIPLLLHKQSSLQISLIPLSQSACHVLYCGCVGSRLRPRLRLHLVPACTFLSHMMGSFAKKDDFSLSLGADEFSTLHSDWEQEQWDKLGRYVARDQSPPST